MSTGTVFWFTGLAGRSSFCQRRVNSVFLDGDQLREVFGNDLGHTPQDRLASATRNARLCKMLSDQGIDVVCATISMLHACRAWNRAHIASYWEIYVRAPMAVLEKRDPHGLYSRARRGEIANVVGIDIAAEEPERPDLVLESDGTRKPADLAELAWQKLGAP